MADELPFIHETAIVEDAVSLGARTKVWHHSHVRTGARVGSDCVIGKSSFVDVDVVMGDRVKIQNHVSVFHGVELGDEVMVGPSACFTNDLKPRSADGWVLTKTKVGDGVGIGANSTILCGVTIGDWAMIGAGTVVVSDVPPHALVVGNPSRIIGWVDQAGNTVHRGEFPPEDLSILSNE